MSRATLGFSRVTRTRTHQNPYPHPRAWVFGCTGQGFTKTHGYPNLHTGMPPEMTSKPRKGSASVNQHCRAALRGLVSRENGNRGAEHAPRCSMLWQLMLEIIDGLVDMALIDAASMWHRFQPRVVVIGHSRVHWWGLTLWGMN